MAKRIADKELTDRNWDQEEEREEAGTFSLAADDILKSRPIKKAKRRNAGAENESGGAFKAFKGFSLTGSGPGGGGAFTGFGNGTGFKPVSTTLANGNSQAPATPAFTGFASVATTAPPAASLTFNGPTSSPPPAADVTGKQANGSAPGLSQSAGVSATVSGSGREYSRQLTALNCSVRDWIVKHVNDNPLCDLNPIFRDYERHLASIEKKYGPGSGAGGVPGGGAKEASQAVTSSAASQTVSPGTTTTTTPPAPASQSKAAATSQPPPGVSFNFGKKVDSSLLTLGSGTAPLSFTFSGQSSAGALFGGQGSSSSSTPAATFSFSGAKTETEGQNGGAEEESEEPPVPVVTEVKEEDAFYSKKCKLFYKKEAEFKEKGVGTLHLKRVSEGKIQMIVRADTNLGNILLNILVPPAMPCSRMGKNNVMAVCVPNPPVDEKNPSLAVPLLIRVKTGEEADELHKLLQDKA